ncbi:helix-turn-helix domain-containing protein [Yoonia sp. 208BN28-4]|uniref:helix-turn-helix domain-containing protein n=1 Tax=Yoonia sp. 208BN28-4 TaxID=3126505 RepID=UPI0030A1EF51
MIVRGFRRAKATEEVESNGFDAFELRLGDLMRGERATMGKSLLDVQRELKIKAAYIAAIENSDPTAFDTPGFIAGYVRSYARYLNMDPDWAFDTFCRESGFATAHGMSAAASAAKPVRVDMGPIGSKDIFSGSATPFVPAGDSMFGRVEPGAVGSLLVLVALIGGLGYGGWTVLQEVQRVQFAPVEQTPTVVSDIDPLAGATASQTATDDVAGFVAPSTEALDRLYRPQALDVPVLVSRDGPIASLNPGTFGAVVPETDLTTALADAGVVAPAIEAQTPAIQVLEGPVPEVQLVAASAAWVRVRAADGAVIFEGIMEEGDTFALPATEEAPTLRVGESGGIYFSVNGQMHGPAGPRGSVTSNLELSAANLSGNFPTANPFGDAAPAVPTNVAQVQADQ